MKPIQYVLLWFGQALLFTVLFVLLYVLIPEIKMYRLITESTGFMSDFTWEVLFFGSLRCFPAHRGNSGLYNGFN